ncbi:MAG: hypothetical protein ACF8QF_04315 [Phycisphaerales bacterium]
MRVQSWIGRRPTGRSGVSVRVAAAAIVAAAGSAAPAVASVRGELARAQREAELARDAALRARISADWASGLTGGWFDPTRWSGGVVPQNDGVDEYDATIGAPGNYSVLINGDAHVSTLALTAGGATLELFSGSLTVDETFTLSEGTFRLRDGVATLSSVNLTSGLFDIDGGVLEVGGVLRSAGATVRFDAGTIRNTVYDGDDTKLVIAGRTGKTFDNVIITDGVLRLGPTQGLRIRNGFATVNGGGLWVDGGRLDFEGVQTLTGVNLQASALFETEFRLVESASLTVGADMSLVGGGFKFFGATGAVLRNNGHFGDARFRAGAGRLENYGSIDASVLEWAEWENNGAITDSSVLSGSGVNNGSIGNTSINGAWLNNAGATIEFDAAGGTLAGNWTNSGLISGATTLAGSWINHGTINATAGSTLRLEGAWVNTGTINADNAALTIVDGFQTLSLGNLSVAGATITVEGQWNNTGAAYEIGAGSEWIIKDDVFGGAITTVGTMLLAGNGASVDNIDFFGDLEVGAGVIGANFRQQSGVTRVIANGAVRFDNGAPAAIDLVVAGGKIQLNASQELILDDQSSLLLGGSIDGISGARGRFVNEGSVHIDDSGHVARNVLDAENRGVWTIGENAQLRQFDGNFINNGVVQAAQGGSIWADGAAIRNNGDMTIDGGWLRVERQLTNGSTQRDSGATLTIRDATAEAYTVVNHGTLALENAHFAPASGISPSFFSDGVITMDTSARIRDFNQFELGAGGVLDIHFDETVLDRTFPFVFVGNLTVDGALRVRLDGEFSLDLGERIVILGSGGRSGEFAAILLPTLANGYTFDAVYTPIGMYLEVVIPTPSAAALLALAGLTATRRRRR